MVISPPPAHYIIPNPDLDTLKKAIGLVRPHVLKEVVLNSSVQHFNAGILV